MNTIQVRNKTGNVVDLTFNNATDTINALLNVNKANNLELVALLVQPSNTVEMFPECSKDISCPERYVMY